MQEWLTIQLVWFQVWCVQISNFKREPLTTKENKRGSLSFFVEHFNSNTGTLRRCFWSTSTTLSKALSDNVNVRSVYILGWTRRCAKKCTVVISARVDTRPKMCPHPRPTRYNRVCLIFHLDRMARSTLESLLVYQMAEVESRFLSRPLNSMNTCAVLHVLLSQSWTS